MSFTQRKPLRAKTPMRAMSEKRVAALAAEGVRPSSTLAVKAPKLAAAPAKRKRQRDTGPTAATRRLIAERSDGMCEGTNCGQPATDHHHRLNRKAGGRHGEAAIRINGAAWLIHTCRRHHAEVTSPFGPMREKALRSGWLLLEHQDGTTVPVLYRGRWVLLTNDGQCVPVPAEAVA